MSYEEINKIAELEEENRELNAKCKTFENALTRIQLGNDVVASEIANQALVMGNL